MEGHASTDTEITAGCTNSLIDIHPMIGLLRVDSNFFMHRVSDSLKFDLNEPLDTMDTMVYVYFVIFIKQAVKIYLKLW